MRVRKIQSILVPLTAALFLAGSVTGTELKNIEKITPQGSEEIDITGKMDLNGKSLTDSSGTLSLEGGNVEVPNGNLAVSGNTDGVDLDNPGTAITVNSNQYEVSDNSISITELDTGSTDTRYLNRGGDAMNGNLNMDNNNINNIGGLQNCGNNQFVNGNGNCETDDDRPGGNDFGNANDLDSNGNLQSNTVADNEIKDNTVDNSEIQNGADFVFSDIRVSGGQIGMSGNDPNVIVHNDGNDQSGAHWSGVDGLEFRGDGNLGNMEIESGYVHATQGAEVSGPATINGNLDVSENRVGAGSLRIGTDSAATFERPIFTFPGAVNGEARLDLHPDGGNREPILRMYPTGSLNNAKFKMWSDSDTSTSAEVLVQANGKTKLGGGNVGIPNGNLDMSGGAINNIGGLQNCNDNQFVDGNGNCETDDDKPGTDDFGNADDLDNQGNIDDFSAASDLNQNGDITSFDNANDLNSNGDISSFDNANDLDSNGNLQTDTVADNEIKDNTVDNTEIQNSNQFTFGGITNNGNLDMNNNRVRKVSNLDVSTSSEQIASFSSTGIDFNQPLSLESSGPLSVANGVDLTGSGSNTLESYSTLYLTTSSGSPSDIVLDPSGQVGVDSNLEIVGNTSIKGNLDLNKNTLTGVSALEDEDGNSCGDNEFLDGNGNCDTHSVDDSVEGSELDGTFSSNGVLKRTGDNTYTAKGTLPDGDVTKSLTIDNTGNIDARSIQLDGSTLSSSGSGLKVDASKVNINNLKNSGDLADEASVSTSQIDEDAVTNTEIANSQTLKVSRIEDSDDNTYYVNLGDSSTSANLNGAVKVDTGEVSSDQRMCIGDRCA